MAEALDVFLIMLAILLCSLLVGFVSQRRCEEDLSRKLNKIFDDAKRRTSDEDW